MSFVLNIQQPSDNSSKKIPYKQVTTSCLYWQSYLEWVNYNDIHVQCLSSFALLCH